MPNGTATARTMEELFAELRKSLADKGIEFPTEATLHELLTAAIDVVKKAEVNEVAADATVAAESQANWMADLPDGEEKRLIANALRDHGGNAKEAMLALQKKLLKPYTDREIQVPWATKKLRESYPVIFA